VEDAVCSWLAYGLAGRAHTTAVNYASLAEVRITDPLGRRRLHELSADDVDRWLRAQAKEVSTRTLRLLYSILKRAVIRAMARDKVRRNVVSLCNVPTGQAGRPSKSLTLAQASAVLAAAERSPLHAYIVLSLLSGARTEEVRALRWSDVDLTGDPETTPPTPPSVGAALRPPDRRHQDSKVPPPDRDPPARCQRCAQALRQLRRCVPGSDALVFGTANGTELDAHNVRRTFRRVLEATELDPTAWTPRELRHSFVSLLSDSGIPLEQIARLLGHNGTAVTERVYRHQLRPILEEGAVTMDAIFPERPEP
jgi:integrase